MCASGSVRGQREIRKVGEGAAGSARRRTFSTGAGGHHSRRRPGLCESKGREMKLGLRRGLWPARIFYLRISLVTVGLRWTVEIEVALAGPISAQAGWKFPGLGPGCGLGAGKCARVWADGPVFRLGQRKAEQKKKVARTARLCWATHPVGPAADAVR